MKNPFKNIGPGILVAAAFIGPGTVTVCTLAGVQFGYALLWALSISIVATIVLQETSARIGLVTQKGLAQVLRDELHNPLLKKMILGLVLVAIVFGNAAYEAGNISGGVLGIQLAGLSGVFTAGGVSINVLSLLLGALAFFLLYLGNYKVLERILLSLVILMSCSFLITAILTKPDWGLVFQNALLPSFDTDQLLMIIALVGTTVVPYNLFLHASLVNQKWKDTSDLKHARTDTYLAIILGGFVSMCVVIAAAAIPGENVDGLTGLAKSLEPLYGEWANYFIALGLFAAGLTSAITAPLAAAYVAQGCLGFSGGMKSVKFKSAWMLVLITGTVFASLGIKPIEIIQFAQIANGLLLPVIAGILIWLANRSQLLGDYSNSWVKNGVSIVILAITIVLGARTILNVLGIL
ncbi:Nramp family divalent metal transporter [Flavimarina sp. Hel_I_48]|uniref:Nramp family divalent metal transporter n=1 Tax=Flavimarina sp. Hel_I_48 TaxID=1392488 RepID=UPI0004DF5530|nr:Nramp family divalent metal transporter [Flavimarina sp. Hel_I_48]